MHYEEQVIDGVLHYRTTADGKWVAMSAERLTAMLLETRQTKTAPAIVGSPHVWPVTYPVITYPVPSTAPVEFPWYTITCGGHAQQ